MRKNVILFICILIGLYACKSKSDRKELSVNGIWESIGSGWILQITDSTNYNFYDFTSISCFPSRNGKFKELKKSLTLKNDTLNLLTGVITAFSGPIAFVGLAVPHIARMFFSTSNHKILLPATALIGAIVLLLCDIIAQLPTSEYTLPINAITSLFGAPIVIWLLIRKKKLFV